MFPLFSSLFSSLFFSLSCIFPLRCNTPDHVPDVSAGSLQECLTDSYNDDLRALLEAGELQDEDIKQLLKNLRDIERVPEGSLPPPSLVNIENLGDASPQAIIGAVCKLVVQLTRSTAVKV